MTTGINQFVRELSQTLTAERFGELPEAELVRLVAARDQTAFEAVVRKHGALVLSAARAVLSDEADVADVFQATFLALWRGGARIRNGMALGPWLFGVSRRAALKAAARARRRRQIEHSKTAQPTIEAVDLTWREACGILHEEIQRLPAQYRLPIILCHMEGLSRDEAAGKLKCKLDTLRGRLARGREMLKRRLIRRGVALSAGMLAWLAGESADATDIPASLVIAATRLTSISSANVPSCVTEVLPGAGSMLTRKSILAAIALLAVGILTTSLVGGEQRHMSSSGGNQSRAELTSVQGEFAASDSPDEPKQPKQQKAAEPAANSKIELKGQVLNAKGELVPGAKLTACGRRAESWVGKSVHATADPTAQFTLELAADPLHSLDKIRVIATASGSAPLIFDVPAKTNSQITVRLPENAAIDGRIVSQDGKPVSGAEIQMMTMTLYESKGLDDHLTEMRNGKPRYGTGVKNQFIYTSSYSWVLPELENVAKTDADGRFHLANVGRDRLIDLVVRGAGIETADILVRTQPGPPLQMADLDDIRNLYVAGKTFEVKKHERGLIVYGMAFELRVRPSRLLRGTARDKVGGKPVAGVTVTESAVRTFAVTDANGEFELQGCPSGVEYNLTATPSNGAAYFITERRIPGSPGQEPLATDIQMLPGIVMSGRLLDGKAGKPLEGEVLYTPLEGNEALSPQRDSNGSYFRTDITQLSLVGVDGAYCVVVAPGRGVVLARSKNMDANMKSDFNREASFPNGFPRSELKEEKANFPGALLVPIERGFTTLSLDDYHAVVPIWPDSGTNSIKEDINLAPATTVRVRILDPEGNPVAGFSVLDKEKSWREVAGSESTIVGVNPKRPATETFFEPKRNLVGSVTIRGTETDTVDVRLSPGATITGRIVDLEGKPVPTVRLQNFVSMELAADGTFSQIQIGLPENDLISVKNGEFRIIGLSPGWKFVFAAEYQGLVSDQVNVGPLKPNETRDMGTISLHKKGENQSIQINPDGSVERPKK